MQIPDPDLVNDVGVIAWLLMAMVSSGIITIGFFLNRITKAMDRMAVAQESTPAIITELKTIIVERLDKIQDDLSENVELAQEHVRIGQLWEKTELAGRVVRRED